MINEFDSRAQDWDKDIAHFERAQVIANELLTMVPLTPNIKKALEYGAGTGLLSFNLTEFFDEITMMDSSSEMVNVMRDKISATQIKKMKPVFIDLEKVDYPTSFDIIYTQMTLHHIEQPVSLLEKFYKMLNPGGTVAIVDLYKEDGSFHGPNFNGHLGFDPQYLYNILTISGFKNIRHKTCYTIRKTVQSGEIKDFPLFLIIAEK